jgi:hypothetical protein
MSLEPLFSLSPLSPKVYTYNAADPKAPFASAYIETFGGVTGYAGPRTFSDQHSNDQILLANDPVPETDQTITNVWDDIYRRSGVALIFYGSNVSTVNQYLLVFRLASYWNTTPTAQFFVGTSLVRAEALTQSPYDKISILLDTPGNNSLVYTYVRLAGTTANGFLFKGVDCYLL